MLIWADILKFSEQGNLIPNRRLNKSTEEWKEILTPEEFAITREKRTEPAYSSTMYAMADTAVYLCACCDEPLFNSSAKYVSKSGWPAFFQPITKNVIAYTNESKYGEVCIKVRCNICDSHLGHVFPDGPKPTWLRYCINALALNKQSSV